MSKIRDLYAEEEGIEDLMRPDAVRKSELLKAVERVIDDNFKDIRSQLSEDAEFDVDWDDEGHESLMISNFDSMCDSVAESYLEDYVYINQVDINDDDYSWVLDHLKKYAAKRFDSCYLEIIKEAEEND